MEQKIKISVINDNMIGRKLLINHLNELPGIEVISEASGAEQLTPKFETTLPDMVILALDQRVPVIFDCIKHIREKTPKMKIIVFTPNDSSPVIISLVENGANAIIYKMDEMQLLTEVIYQLMKNEFFFNLDTFRLMAETILSRKKRNKWGSLHLDEKDSQIIDLIVKKQMKSKDIAPFVFLSIGAVNKRRRKIAEILGISAGAAALMEYALKNEIR